MPFDISSAVEVQGETIPTTKFDVYSAQELNAKPSRKPGPISKFLRDIFRKSPIEEIQTAFYELDKKSSLPKPIKGESMAAYQKRWDEVLRPREEEIASEGVIRQVEAPMALAVGATGMAAPVATAKAVAGFSILDHFFNARRLIEEKAPTTTPIIKDIVEILDFTAKGSLLGGMTEVGREKIPAIKSWVMDRFKNLNLPKSVSIPPEQVLAIKDKKILPEKLGIEKEHIDASINSGLPVQVPVEKVLNLAMDSKWEIYKKDLGLSLEKEILPKEKERGFITSVKESPQVTKETKQEIVNLPKEKLTYEVYSDKEALAKAQEKVATNPEEALTQVLTIESVNKDITTTGLELMRKFREEGNIEQEVNVAENLAKKGTESGQFIQAFSILDKLSPDGILVFAQRELNRGVDISKRKLITPDFADALKRQAQKIQDAPEGYAKVIEVKKLTEMIAEKKGRSVGDWVIEAANLPRTLAASLFDFSFGLRQGAFLLPSFPKEWGSAFSKQFSSFAKEENYNSLMDSIMKHPDYQTALDSGVSFTDIRTKLSKIEEKYMGASLAEKVPILGKGVIATQRAYTAMANKMRMDIFSRMLQDYKNVGLELTPKLLKQTATFVNAGTGRGGLAGEFAKSAGLLNAFFFSPRLMSSRLTLLNPAYYVTREPGLRKQALKSLFSFIGFGATTLTMAKMMGADVGTDPRSSDFGKIKVGNTRIDTWGGFQQYARMFAQEITGEYVSSTTGKKITLGEGYRPLTRMEILMRQIESKEAPVFSLITKLLGENRDWDTGKKLNVPKEILQKFEPMVASDLYDLYQEDPMLLPLGILTVFGAGVQTYKSKKSSKF